MSRISLYNHEGYRDPTAYAALNSAEKAHQKKQHEVRCSVYKNNPYRPLVFICSPFAGDIKRNVAAARQYCKFAVSKGNIPFAPHLLFPQFLNDGNLYDRETGMVMGLAILPGRLKKEMADLKTALLNGEDLRANDELAKHADWADEFMGRHPEFNADNAEDIIKDEIGQVFAKVLECAGVYKCTEEGRNHLKKFLTEVQNG